MDQIDPRAPTVAAIVPATDDPPTLGRALDALASGRQRPETVVVVRDCDRPGPAAARNRGAADLPHDVLLFVDSDVIVAEDAVARLRRRFAGDPGLAAVFGAYDDAPEDPGVVSRFRNLLHHHVHASSPGPAGTFWAGLGAVRRADFERVGGFDALHFPDASVEDVDLGARLVAEGARIELDPAIRGRHLKRWSLSTMVSTDLRRRGVPWARLVLEGRAPAAGLNLDARHRLGAAATTAAVLALLLRRPAASLACASLLVASNLRFYGLLARVGGPRLALAGPPLHAVHHLCGVAAALGALAAHLAGGDRR